MYYLHSGENTLEKKGNALIILNYNCTTMPFSENFAPPLSFSHSQVRHCTHAKKKSAFTFASFDLYSARFKLLFEI